MRFARLEENVLVPFSPTQPPVSATITAVAIKTATTTTTTAAIRVSMFTILTSIAATVVLAHASTLPQNLRQRQSANSTIQWQPCTNAPAPAECAQFTYVFHNPPSQINMPLTPYTNSVPLDYANPAAGTTQIAMIRFQAEILPRRGSIFMNPGSHLCDLPCASTSHSRLSRWSGRGRRGVVDNWCPYVPIHRR